MMMQEKMIKEKDMEQEIIRAFRWYVEIDDEFEEDEGDDKANKPVGIDRDKLISVAKNTLSEEIDEYIIDRMIEVADSDNDGIVTQEDFLRVMKKMKLY